MKKILVPIVNTPIGSEAAYQAVELADSLVADIFILFFVGCEEESASERGKLAFEIFEEAAQNYQVNIDGKVLADDPNEVVKKLARDWAVDLILVSEDIAEQWTDCSTSLNTISDCEVKWLCCDMRTNNCEQNQTAT